MENGNSQKMLLQLNYNLIQFAPALDALNTNNQKVNQVIQWTTLFQILESITTSRILSLVSRPLNKLENTKWDGRKLRSQRILLTLSQISVSIKISLVFKMVSSGLNLNSITNGNQLRIRMDSGTSQRLLPTAHTLMLNELKAQNTNIQYLRTFQN